MKMVKYNTSIPAHDYNHPYNCIHYNNNTYQHGGLFRIRYTLTSNKHIIKHHRHQLTFTSFP